MPSDCESNVVVREMQGTDFPLQGLSMVQERHKGLGVSSNYRNTRHHGGSMFTSFVHGGLCRDVQGQRT